MNLVYVANVRLPTEKAHGVAIIRMCGAFRAAGHKVSLLVPRRFNRIREKWNVFYGVQETFTVTKIFCLDFVFFKKISFLIQSVTFGFGVLFWVVFHRGQQVYYGRDEFTLWLLSLFCKDVIWEAHTPKTTYAARSLGRKRRIVVISEALRQHFISLGVPETSLLVAPSGVDIALFDNVTQSPQMLKKELGLPEHARLVSYIGKFKTMGLSKGVEELVSDFESIHAQYPDTLLLLVGAEATETDFYNRSFVKMIPAVSAHRVPLYMKASEILVMNYPADSWYAAFMSPLKLFEYMASQRPIVSVDLPSIREILNERNSLLVAPGKVGEGIVSLLTDEKKASRLARQAHEDVQAYSWEKRARNIIDFIMEKHV